MMIARRLFLVAAPLALLASANAAQTQQQWSWDGAWTGLLGKTSVISVTVRKDGAVDYVFRGAPMPIQYSKITDETVSFGDRDHYSMTLTRTGDKTASATYHGRNGFATAALVKL